MRYMAWIAIISLQMSMFVCGAGIDVCHASDAPAHIEVSQSTSDGSNAPVDQVCAAHAAHVFLGHVGEEDNVVSTHIEVTDFLTALQIPEILNLIEQPPKFPYS